MSSRHFVFTGCSECRFYQVSAWIKKACAQCATITRTIGFQKPEFRRPAFQPSAIQSLTWKWKTDLLWLRVSGTPLRRYKLPFIKLFSHKNSGKTSCRPVRLLKSAVLRRIYDTLAKKSSIASPGANSDLPLMDSYPNTIADRECLRSIGASGTAQILHFHSSSILISAVLLNLLIVHHLCMDLIRTAVNPL